MRIAERLKRYGLLFQLRVGRYGIVVEINQDCIDRNAWTIAALHVTWRGRDRALRLSWACPGHPRLGGLMYERYGASGVHGWTLRGPLVRF